MSNFPNETQIHQFSLPASKTDSSNSLKSNFITSTMVFSSSSQSIHDIHLPIHWKFQSVLFTIWISDPPNSFIQISFNSTPYNLIITFFIIIQMLSQMFLSSTIVSPLTLFEIHNLTLHIILIQMVSSSSKSCLPS